MKKALFVLTLLVCCVPLLAQQQHMTFSGIPINGTITQFQTKLQAKGYTHDRSTSASFPVGCRAFKGTFAGEKVSLYVYYDQQTKVVYRVKALMEDLNENRLEHEYNRMYNLIRQKYPEALEDEDSNYEGRDACTLYILKQNIREGMYLSEAIKGRIDLYSGEDTYYLYEQTYTLHIDYWDIINSNKHDANILNDL